ncbi:MAG: ABC transporter substrate-binding protein, partial [Spirochaetales bacterium]|nr:ABC transporter substrate-binding protein [Spirochaetales bacterium]
VVRTDYLKENPTAVRTFLREYEKSIEFVKNNPAEAGQMCANFGIVPAAPIATKAIPDCNLIFVSGDQIRKDIEGYFQVLFDANPKAIGGKMPQDDFYTLEF